MKHLLTIAALTMSISCAAQTQEQETTKTEYPMNQTTLTLNNGVVIPQFGLGVYSIPAGETTYNSVLAALKAGYRHIDTAHAYANERSVGQAVKDSGIPREEIWITSKLWPNEYDPKVIQQQIDKMLDREALQQIHNLSQRRPMRHRHIAIPSRCRRNHI